MLAGIVKGALGTIVGPLFGWLKARDDNETVRDVQRVRTKGEVASDLLRAENENNRLRAQQFGLLFGWPPFRWLMFSMMAVAVYHTAGVYLDSCGRLPVPVWGPDGLGLMPHKPGSWRFVELPDVYKDQSLKIIGVVTGVQIYQTTVGAIFRWLDRR